MTATADHLIPRRAGPNALWLAVALVAVGLPLLISVFYVGFQASDDIHYLNGALAWTDHFPYVGTSHWTLRHTITLPTALALRWFGLNEGAAGLTGVLYFTAFLAVNLWGIRRTFGPVATVFAVAALLTLPGFLVVATYLNPDVPELFFVSTAFWLLLWAREDADATGRWVLAGLAAGTGFVNRQTAAAFVLFVVAVWLLRPGVARRRYLPMALAFVAVVAADWLYLTVMTGQPAYRFSIDLHHDPVDRWAEVARVAAAGAWIDKEGNLSVNVWVDPVLNLFVTQKYTLVFWGLLPALVAVWRQRRSAAAPVRHLLLGLGAVSFLFVAANPKLYLVPRYFLPAAWATVVLVSWWLADLWTHHRRRTAAALLAVLLLANAAALSVENVDPRRPERELVEWVRRHPGQPIHTDIETRARAEFFFRFAGQDIGAVSTEPPAAGSLFFYSARRVAECAALARCRDRARDYQPQRTWRVQEVIDGPLRPGARVAAALGLRRLLPPDVAQRVFAPVGSVTLYLVQQGST